MLATSKLFTSTANPVSLCKNPFNPSKVISLGLVLGFLLDTIPSSYLVSA